MNKVLLKQALACGFVLTLLLGACHELRAQCAERTGTSQTVVVPHTAWGGVLAHGDTLRAMAPRAGFVLARPPSPTRATSRSIYGGAPSSPAPTRSRA